MRENELCAAIDLHSNNNYLAIVDGEDHRVFERRLKNEISAVLAARESWGSWGHIWKINLTPREPRW